MSWVRRLFGGSRSEASSSLWLEVRCSRCGEVIRVRVDPRYELRQDLQDGRDQRILDKDIIGTQCFALIHAHVELAMDLTVLASDVSGGEFVNLSRSANP